jgi:hypothetical protein
MNALIIEMFQAVQGVVPLNTTGAAGATPWIDMSKAPKVVWAICTGAWAGGTPAVTLSQAQDNAGTGVKSLQMKKYWVNTFGNTVGGDAWTETAVTSDTFNLGTPANRLFWIETFFNDLDMANGFNHARLNFASPGANADLIGVLVLAGTLFHMGNPTIGRESILG